MKKMLFVAAFALFASIAVAQQPSTTKAEKKASKKVTKAAKTVEAKKAEVAKATEIVEAPKNVAMPTEQLTLQPTLNPNQPQQVAPQQAPAPQVDIAKVFEFTNDNYDFGKIVGGKAVEYTITIKNISKEEATLTYVAPTCGCTTPKYEANKKFAPGESVQVVLGFNGGSPGQASPFSKVVNITLNGNLSKSVTFKGETYVAPAEPAPANPSLNKF